MSRFFPQGKTVLNRTEWRGKEPRSCGVTDVKIRLHAADSDDPLVADVEITYRPKGCITYIGGTKYDGWTAVVIDRARDGTLLDGHGNPLPEGQPPVELRFELYDDADFNEIDFGEFVGEFETEGIKHFDYDEVIRMARESGRISAGMKSRFVVPRRRRPSVKIVLSNSPSGTSTDGFGTRIINVSNYTPQRQQTLVDEFTQLVFGFLEGRYSIKSLSTDEFVFVELSDVLVDCTPNAEGKESRFDCFNEYMPEGFLNDLAARIAETYEVDVSVVNGAESGLLFRPSLVEP